MQSQSQLFFALAHRASLQDMAYFDSSSQCGYSSMRVCRSSLFQVSDDIFHCLLSWLDIGSISSLDIAVGNKSERLQWVKCLGEIESKAINEYRHSHSSLRWLITRGARTISIYNRSGGGCDINDRTFLGLNLSSTAQSLDRHGSNYLMDTVGENFNMGGTGVQGISHNVLLSLILISCSKLTDVGVSAIAHGCPQLTTINLSECVSITDVGISAIGRGCPQLTTINLANCYSITDVGRTALKQLLPLLTISNTLAVSKINGR